MKKSAQATYTKIFFKEWHRMCSDRLGLKRVCVYVCVFVCVCVCVRREREKDKVVYLEQN